MTSTKLLERVHVGCQGWNYNDWVTRPAEGSSIFYPHGTRSDEMLQMYARVFETVEVDSTFYAIPSISTVDNWNKRTPRRFSFSLKLPQEITHVHELRPEGATLFAAFCDRIQLLDEKLAVVLIQLSPQFEASTENIRALHAFLTQLPRDVRFSIEFRSRSWMQPSIADMLAEYNVAVALVEGKWIALSDLWQFAAQTTADFAYIRWMGERDLMRFDVVQRPQDANLQAWSEMIAELCERVTRVYAYFSNFYEGHAPASANKLKRLLGQLTVDAGDLEDQPSLF